jgi:hypothetical protein
MEDGQIIEKGTHDQLIALDGEYAWMYKMQKDPAPAGESEEIELEFE